MQGSAPSGDRYTFAQEVLDKARAMGITKEHLLDMVVRSTRITHPDGNRRFHNFLFAVGGNEVLRIGYVTSPTEEERAKVKCQMCLDSGQINVFEPCGVCDGAGCAHCDKGLIPAKTLCPACSVDKHL